MFLILLTFSGLFYNYESYRTEESCDWDLYFCEYYNPYPMYYTRMFKCDHHLNCPQNFKCCKHDCFRHKICQPYRNRPTKLLTPIVHHPHVQAKPGVCDVRISCDVGFSSSLTKHFECVDDYACPDHYKCCHIECWGHKVCQPLKEVTENQTSVASTITMTVPVESYVHRTTSTLPLTTLHNVTFDNYSVSIETTSQQYTTVEPLASSISAIEYNTTLSDAHTYLLNDTQNSDIDKSTNISYNTTIIEEELHTNYTTVAYITVTEKNISSSIKPNNYSEDNNRTTYEDFTNTLIHNNTMITITITNTSYQTIDKINVSNNNSTTISNNGSVFEEKLHTGHVLTTVESVTRGIKNTTNYTTFPYVTVPDQDISSSIKPNHYSKENNRTTNVDSTDTITTKTINDTSYQANATINTHLNNSTTISDVSHIEQDLRPFPNIIFDRYGGRKYEELYTDQLTTTSYQANETTNVNINNFTTISYNASINEESAIKTNVILNTTTATKHQKVSVDNELTIVIGEINSTLQNASSIQKEDMTPLYTILETNITLNPMTIVYEDTYIAYSGDGDHEQITRTDDEDEDFFIDRNGDGKIEEYQDDKPIWF